MFTTIFIIGVIALLVWLIGGAAALPAELIAVARIVAIICLVVILILAIVSAVRPHFLGVWW